MHDVPKAAVRKAMAGPPSAHGDSNRGSSAKKYTALLNEDADETEEAEVGTTYPQ